MQVRHGIGWVFGFGGLSPEPDRLDLWCLEARDALKAGTPMSSVAMDAGHHEPHIRTRAPLAFLSPRLQQAILDGTLPPEITLERVLKAKIPLDWDAQEKLFPR